jgi:hypothetical protein
MCALVATTVCMETLHRLVYERKHGNGTFPFVLAAPRKLRSICRRDGCWTRGRGAYLGDVLEKMDGGARTTNAPTPAPSFLPLFSFRRHSWPSAEQIADLLDQEGLFVAAIWVNPWYCLFNSAKGDDSRVHIWL